jgi:2-oxo-4-hydroxy-4-carboxy--5-ureidoimidazoline (OHCU) decarboxylase
MAPAPISSDELPRLERDRFIELFGGVFEHAPWVAERAVSQR